MQIRHTVSATETRQFNTQELRENFLVPKLMETDTIRVVYSHYDRVIIGGVRTVQSNVILPTYNALKAGFFLERREIGVINVGGKGVIEAGDSQFELSKLDCLYVGRGTENVSFRSLNSAEPALYFLLSAPAHQTYPTCKMTKEEASPVAMGALETSNERTIYKYIHQNGIQSCQLVMGLTVLKNGSVWNTMPTHVHDRRMEAYFYFDLPEEHRVFHLMGQPHETRHLIVGNQEAIISPPWSVHSGCGTSSYSFIWGMAGENTDFTDMDFAKISELY